MFSIEYVYSKKRKQFGRDHSIFAETEPEILIDYRGNKDLSTKYIVQNPRHKGVQSMPELSNHDTNTEVMMTKEQGCTHMEGGWPKDVDPSEIESKKRYIKKVEQEEKYPKVMKNLTENMEHYIKQNLTLNMFEEYFSDSSSSSLIGDSPFAQVVTVFKDPSAKENIPTRTAVSLSWQTSQEARKIAAAYCVLQFQKASSSFPLESYIWDTENPLVPSETLLPKNYPLWSVEFNPKEAYLIVGGTYGGDIQLFDIRKGSAPIVKTEMAISHKDPVYDVKWVQSKGSTQCMSISTDGQVIVWDTKNLSEPLEQYRIELPEEKTGGLLKGVAGSCSMNYNATYSPMKFLLGTEQNVVVSCTRRKNKPLQIERVFFGHFSPVTAVMRSPFLPTYFLSIGDWTAKIWHEEITTPVLSTYFHKTYLTTGLWSPTKPTVFFTGKMDGSLDVWDLGESQTKPTFSLNVASVPLHSIISHRNGRKLAVGDCSGNVSLVQLSDYLALWENELQGVDKKKEQADKDTMQSILEREAKREKIVEENKKLILIEKKRLSAAENSAKEEKSEKTDKKEEEKAD